MIIPLRRRATPFTAAVLAALGGAIAAAHYHRLDLTLSHYDARGHLVVARRIVDSITPGWQQIGAVWLPLPHLLNALPVQVDAWYRSGASGVAISVLAFALATGAIANIVLTLTESTAGAAVAATVFALNPNIVYLQATPMTEPLLVALTTLAVAMLIEWCRDDANARDALRRDKARGGAHGFAGGSADARRRASIGIVLALACLTRYEAWPIAGTALAASVFALWRRGAPTGEAARSVGRIAAYPAIAIVAFAVFSRIVIGEWLVARGFFVPENKSLGKPLLAAAEIAWGTRQLSGPIVLWCAFAGLLVLLTSALVRRSRAHAAVALSLVATAVLPWGAFVDGHPFRIRYMVPLLAFEAVAAGTSVGALRSLKRRADIVVGVAALLVAAYELRPLDAGAPMVVEAQWDRPNVPVRARVTACLLARRDDEKIMASMGSLGHYMQEASRAGFRIRDFLHEGNGDIWLAALERPRPFAGWILIEEKAEGGDMLARRAREDPGFLDGYSRVCDGAGLALYKRDAGRTRPGEDSEPGAQVRDFRSASLASLRSVRSR